jgi:hypothetical protein
LEEKRGSGSFTVKNSGSDGDSDSNEAHSRLKHHVPQDWRTFFFGEELEKIYEQIEEGDDPNEEEDKMSCSDDNASEDNLDPNDLYRDVYLKGDTAAAELEAVKAAESLLKKELHQQQEEQRKKALVTLNLRHEDDFNELNERLTNDRAESDDSQRNLKLHDNSKLI